MLLPDQMYGNSVTDDGDNDDNDGDGDDSADLYLREMEMILRKIRRREMRKKTMAKHCVIKGECPLIISDKCEKWLLLVLE